MLVEGEGIEFEIPPTALEKGFGNIHADGLCANARGSHGKGAGVGEGIENAAWAEFSKIGAIRALVAEKAGIVTGVEIDFEAEGVFEDDLGGWAGSVALEQNRRVLFARGADELTAKNARGGEIGFLRPRAEVG